MASDNDPLKRKKETLLAELESIKHLLTDDQNDHIPVLKDAIIEETADLPMNEHTIDDTPNAFLNKQDSSETRPSTDVEESNSFPHSDNERHDDTVNTLLNTSAEIPEAHTSTPGVLPGQQSLFNEAANKAKTEKALDTDPISAQDKQTSLSKNPFLPPHVRERFKKADTEPEKPNSEAVIPKDSPEAIINASYTERLIDQLVAHHLPKIEAELRLKLLAVVKMHNERLKK